MTDEHYRRLETLFYSAPLNQGIFAGSKLTVSERQAVYELTIGRQYFHAAEAMHGAIYFKLLDDAAYFAAATLEPKYFILTKSYTIHFKRPVQEDLLRAEGQVISTDDREIIATSKILNSKGKVVAQGEGKFVKGPTLLSSLTGYSG